MNSGLKITNINVYPVESITGKLKAFVRIVLNDAIQLTNLRIYQGSRGLFVAYPIDPNSTNEGYRQTFYPITEELRTYIQAEILKEYVKES